ncbi:MAG TPA: hypothetical protein VGI06_16230, partial [Acidimicrobiales bacterium]
MRTIRAASSRALRRTALTAGTCIGAGLALVATAVLGAHSPAADSPQAERTPSGLVVHSTFANPAPAGGTSLLTASTAGDPTVGAASTPTGKGWWEVSTGGGVFTFGDAAFHGSAGTVHLNQPIVGTAATPDGNGYWLVATDGGIFSFGDAAFHGSTGAIHLNQPIVGMASTPDGNGYWLVASDGGIFSFGDASFHGSTGAIHLNQPIVAMASTPDGNGYWLAASDGGVFAFGDAGFAGSAAGAAPPGTVVSIAANHGGGYWITDSAGDVFTYGAAPHVASAKGVLSAPVRSTTPLLPSGDLVLVASDGSNATVGAGGV